MGVELNRGGGARRGSEAVLGVDYSMLYSMHTFPAANAGGTMGDVGERTAKPRNIKVRTRT